MNKNRHIPWYIKNPDTFGAKKVRLLCLIAKRLLGSDIFVNCYMHGYNLALRAKEFNNYGYNHVNPLFFIKQLASHSKNILMRKYFDEVSKYYTRFDKNFSRNQELRKLYNEYNSILSWYNICNITRNELKKILDEFETKIVKKLT